jgi:AcrR family transcriptional regulator
MIDAATAFLRHQPVHALSFRSLAQSKSRKFTTTAPLHHFGSRVGLLAAIAARCFTELADTLEDEFQKSAGSVIRVAETYARYAIAQPHLYRAIHDASLWRAVAALPADLEPAAPAQDVWAKAAERARNKAFGVFVNAIEHGQRLGILKEGNPNFAARLVTSLVDGYLFQVIEEHVEPGEADTVGQFVELAIRGLAVHPNSHAVAGRDRTGS